MKKAPPKKETPKKASTKKASIKETKKKTNRPAIDSRLDGHGKNILLLDAALRKLEARVDELE